jgi:DNA helicase II / ATP-dependent DNA helicase PcrA
LEWALGQIDRETKQFSKEFREEQRYLYDQRSGMDEADIVSAGQSHTRFAFQGAAGIAARKKLIRLTESPYFGRIDFIKDGQTGRLPVYIGMNSFIPQKPDAYPVYDWRAPVSSMFYDFELGEAWYQTPGGTVKGSIELRRQFRIRDGMMEYMIENAVYIRDDVLQKELSLSSDDKMKQIVATIQRDQNAIIRNETSPVLIIQGVAGSGKTSIAMHRIAFLLYRFRGTLSSKDILIISPNKVFADYISNVLPELGETQIPEMGMEELANDLLDHKVRFRTYLQQVFSLLHTPDEKLIERVRFKSTAGFISILSRYLVYLENYWFNPTDIQVGNVLVPAPFVRERFNALQRVPLLKRFQMVFTDVQAFVRSAVKRKLTGREKSAIHHALSGAMAKSDVLDLYRGFYDWLGLKDLFRMHGTALENADVFPLIYCKIRLEGVQPYHQVKHLVIDEMQDYTPIQYDVLARLFYGKKTILGDASQTSNPHSASNAGIILEVFPQADVIRLNRSYRSTSEITRFTQHIRPDPDLVAMERHGPEPGVLGFQWPEEEEAAIRQAVDKFRTSGHHILAIICKTPSQANALKTRLTGSDVYLLGEDTTVFNEGVVITTAPMAKGLEFDEVIVPYVSADNYQNDMDKSMLYIACTRAMHRLTVSYHGLPSQFLQGVA